VNQTVAFAGRLTFVGVGLFGLGCGQTANQPDANVDFACNAQANVCHSGTQYCWLTLEGDTVDAGPTLSGYCTDYPATCAASPTCECIVNAGSPCPPKGTPTCTQQGGAITLNSTCSL
jgi:hypothetical protein